MDELIEKAIAVDYIFIRLSTRFSIRRTDSIEKFELNPERLKNFFF